MALLGEENAIGFGNRLAPIGAFLDVYKNITEENFLAVVGGPSGEITDGAVSQLWKVLKNVANGRGELTYEEALRFLRQPSGVDNWFKMAAILKYGVYQSKTGSIAGPKMGITDAIATAFGFTPLAVVEMYDLSRQQYLDDKNFKTLQREISNNAGLALELMETGDEKDWKRGVEILDDISLQIEAYDLPFEMERQLHEAVYQHYGRISKLQALMKKAIRKDNEVLMKISEKFMLEDHSND